MQCGFALGPGAGHPEGKHGLASAGTAHGQVALQHGNGGFAAGEFELGIGFHSVAQAHHGQLHLALHNLAHGLDAYFPVGEEHNMERLPLEQGSNPDFHLGDNAHPTLGSHEHLTNIGAGRRGGKGGDVERTPQGFDATAGKHLLDAAVAQRLLATGAARHPAANG